MNILLTGSSGQLGQELLTQLQALGRVTLVDRNVKSGDRKTIRQDLSELNRVEILLNRMRPDVVVNAAAYTAVDQAENDSATAFRLNAELPACLARWCERNDRQLVHFSTDYVFAGNAGQPYRETDQTGPLNVYGESKLAGEQAVTASACKHFMLRTSWVYSSHGSNFVLTMLRLARERPELSIVSDQIGCPTWARNLARVCCELISLLGSDDRSRVPQGLYHYCDAGVVNWYEFAHAIFSTARKIGLLEELPRMVPVQTSEFPQVARRPLYSVLDTSLIKADFGVEASDLERSLYSCLKETQGNV